VHVHHHIPHVVSHVLEGLVTQNAGVGNKDIQLAKGGYRRIDHTLGIVSIGDRPVVGYGLAAGGFDFVNNAVCH
jgi:hypothetical protein